MIVKPSYPQEVLEARLEEKTFYNKGTRLNVRVDVKRKEVITSYIKSVDSRLLPLDLVDKIYEFINTYEKKELFHEGINNFDLIEHGGWGNNEWVTWFRPIEVSDKIFLRGETK